MPRNRKVSGVTEEQRTIFYQVKSLLLPYANLLDTRVNKTGHYELWTKHSFRSLSMNPRDKRGILFAGVLIVKRHIGLYAYPLHINAELSTKMDAVIQPFWKGNSAFHFDEPLSDLTLTRLMNFLDDGFEYYRFKNWIL